MIQPHLAGVHKLHDAKLWGAAMKAMRNFWAREWLMRDIGAKHGTNDVSTIIKIAQTAGLLSSNAEMTEAGQIPDPLITNQLLYQLSYRGTARVIK